MPGATRLTKETTRIARGATAVFSGSMFSNILTFVFYIVITHMLPLNSLGVLYTLNVVGSFASTFLLLQLPGGFSRFIVGYFQTGRLAEARYLFRKGVLFATLISAVSAPVMVLMAPFITKLLFGAPSYLSLFYLVVADFVLSTYISFLSVVVGARRIFGRGSLVGVVSTVSRIGLAIILIFLGFGLISVLFGWIASDIVSLVAYAHFSRVLWKGETVRSSLKDVVTYSIPFFIAGGLVVVLQNVDRLFVLRFLGTISLGVYGTLLVAASIPKVLPNSLSGTLLPAMVKLEEEKQLTKGVVTKAVRYMAIINLPVLGLVAAVGGPLVNVFLGRSFYHAWPSFSILVFGSGAMSLDIPITQVLLAKKVTKYLAVQQIVSSATLAFFAVLLIPRFYLDGAALAYVCARIAGFVVVGSAVYRLGLFSVRWRDYASSMIVSCSMVATTLGVERYTSFSPLLLPLYLMIGALTGIIVTKISGLFCANDYQEIVDFFPRQLRRFVAYIWKMFGFPYQ